MSWGRKYCGKIGMSQLNNIYANIYTCKMGHTAAAAAAVIASKNTFKLPPICLLHDTVIWPKYHFIHITSSVSWFEVTLSPSLCTHCTVSACVCVCFGARQQISMKCCGIKVCVYSVFFFCYCCCPYPKSMLSMCFLRCLSLFPLDSLFERSASFVKFFLHCIIMKTNINEPSNFHSETNLR